MAKRIYVIMTCDEWKSHSSSRFYAACTSLFALKRIITNGIKEELFSFNDREKSFRAQEKEFRYEWNSIAGDDPVRHEDELLGLCGRVDYVMVIPCRNGIVE